MHIDIRELDNLSVHELQVAADSERRRVADIMLSLKTRQEAADRAAVLSALARVHIYREMPPCALRDIKLLEAQQELATALQDGADGHALAVYRHEYGSQDTRQYRQYTGYVASYHRQPNRR